MNRYLLAPSLLVFVATTSGCAGSSDHKDGEADAGSCTGETWDDDNNPATPCVAKTICAAGTYILDNGSSTTDRTCTKCATGTFSVASNADACTPWRSCNAGSYVSNTPSATVDRVCTSCDQGMYTATANQTSCSSQPNCLAGSAMATAGSTSAAAVCSPCAAGQYCPGGTTPASLCPDDTWDDDQNPATPCANKATCAAGQSISDDGTATTDRVCAPCVSGKFTDKSNESSCTAWTTCVAGTYVSNTPSANTDRVCVACASGTFSNQANLSECLPMGSCGAGTYQTAPGTAEAPPTCTNCSAGQYCAGGTSPAADCSSSQWDDDQSPATACVDKTTCAQGTHVTSSGTSTSDRTCAPCDTGTFTNTSNAQSCTAWTPCSAGTYLTANGSATSDIGCTACPDGTFSTGTNIPSCTAWRVCPLGTAQEGTANTDRVCKGWVTQFGTTKNDEGRAVAVDASGNLYVAGFTTGTFTNALSLSSAGAFVTKYDSTGKVVWVQQFGATATDQAQAVVVDSAGNVYVAGYTTGSFGGQAIIGGLDAFVAKFDSSGKAVWTEIFGTTSADKALAMGIDGSDKLYVAGTTTGSLYGTNAGSTDGFLRAIGSDGTVLWTRQFGTAGIDNVYAVTVDKVNGGIYVSGATSGPFPGFTNAGNYDAFVTEYDSSGNVKSGMPRQFGTTGNDWGYGVAVDVPGAYYVVGATDGAFGTQTNAGGVDVFVAKPSVMAPWTVQWGTTGDDYAYGVAIDSSEKMYVTGYTGASLLTMTATVGTPTAPALTAQPFPVTGATLVRGNFVTLDSKGNPFVAGGISSAVAFAGQTAVGLQDAFLMRFVP